MSGASDADGGVLLDKIEIVRKQINTLLDGLVLDVQQHARANQRIHLPPAPPGAKVSLQPRDLSQNEPPQKRPREEKSPPPPQWLRYFNASKMWKDCDQNWPNAEHKEVYEYLFKQALEQQKPLKT